MTRWLMDATDYSAIKETVEASGDELKEMLEIKNKAAVLKQELSALSVHVSWMMLLS